MNTNVDFDYTIMFGYTVNQMNLPVIFINSDKSDRPTVHIFEVTKQTSW